MPMARIERSRHVRTRAAPSAAIRGRAIGDNRDMRRFVPFIVTCAVLLAISIASTESRVRAAQASGKVRGVYSEAQRMRGEKVYMATCAGCHGATLAGRASLTNGVPPLTGDDFLDEWTGRSVGELFDTIRTTMPKGRPGQLMPQEYTDVTAYILSRNAFPAGPSELVGEVAALKAIPIDDTQTTTCRCRSPAQSLGTRRCLHRGAEQAGRRRVRRSVCQLSRRDAGWERCHTAAGWTRLSGSLDRRDRRGSLYPHPELDAARQAGDPEPAGIREHRGVYFSKNKFPAGAKELEDDRTALRMIRIETSKR